MWCGWLRLWVWCAAVLCDPRLWCRVSPNPVRAPSNTHQCAAGPPERGVGRVARRVVRRTWCAATRPPGEAPEQGGRALLDHTRAGDPRKAHCLVARTGFGKTSLAAQQTRRADEAGSAGPQFGLRPNWFSPGNLCASTRAHSFGSTCSSSHAPDYTSHPRECAKHAPPSLCSCTSVLAQAKPAVGPRVFVRQPELSSGKLVGCSTSVPAPTRRLVWRVVVGAAQFP